MIKLEDIVNMSATERDKLAKEKFSLNGNPSVDNNADMLIHIKVCGEWDGQGLLGNYFNALEKILCEAGGDTVDEDTSLYSLIYYKTGMFAIAALYTILHYQSFKEFNGGKG